ncbi:MAG: hypothetical protein ACK5O2_17535 [Microthrixaceae bacterium]
MTATEPPRTNREPGVPTDGQSDLGAPRVERPRVLESQVDGVEVAQPGGGVPGPQGPDQFDEPVLPPRAEAVVRRRRVESRQRRITWWQAATTVIFIVALAALSWFGYQSALKSGGGTDDRVTDPAAPGYLAEPLPTNADAYVVTKADGTFASALLVVPDASEAGGTLVPLPPSFMVPEYDGAPPQFLSTIYNEEGIDGFRQRLGVALGFNVGAVREVPASAIEQLAGGVAIEVDNVDDLSARNPEGVAEVRYPAGPMTIEPAGIVDFLGFEGVDDPAPNQAIRATAVWQALLGQAAGNTHEELPEGAASEGVGSPPFGVAVDRLNSGEVRFDAVPMAKVPVPQTYFVAWMPDPASLNKFVARVVPVPTSPAAGIRPATAILNGTTDTNVVTAMVPGVVEAGGAVTLVGNADSLDIATTTVQWLASEGQPVAEAIAAQLGVTATEAPAGTGEDLGGAVILVELGTDRTA